MAKYGLAFWFSMSFGFTIFGGLFYLHFRNAPEFEDLESLYKKYDKKEVLLTQNEIRLQSERTRSKEVPVSEEESGYM